MSLFLRSAAFNNIWRLDLRHMLKTVFLSTLVRCHHVNSSLCLTHKKTQACPLPFKWWTQFNVYRFDWNQDKASTTGCFIVILIHTFWKVQWIFIWTHWQFPGRETQWVASTPAGKLLWRLRNCSDGFRRLKNCWWVGFEGKRCCFYSSNGRVAELYSDINLAADVMARSASTSYLKPHRQTRLSLNSASA